MELSIWASFFAGMITFFTPCVLPLVPVYMSFVTGLSVEELLSNRGAKALATISSRLILFIFGFSAIFIAMGAGASFIGSLLISYKPLLSKISGVLIIVFGLYLVGVIKIGFFDTAKRIDVSKYKSAGMIFPFIFGLAFGLGWSSCTAPILGSILLLASTAETVARGTLYLAVYSAGLAVPMFLVGLLLSYFMKFYAERKGLLRAFDKIAGVFLIFFGILLLSGKTNLLFFLSS